jgi:hypothetical protein
MFGRIIPLLFIGAAGYWYWSGPYQESMQPRYEDKLRENRINMKQCLRGEAYLAGATGEGAIDPEKMCAEQYNLYQYKGQWHSYDDVRPEE